jgi:GNAT superfamily N-acetyltransferase
MAYPFREMNSSDSQRLGRFFAGLSAETRRRFGPHPLDEGYASLLCALPHDSAQRFLLLTEDETLVIGYFILDYAVPDHHKQRYAAQGIDLQDGLDPLFAPCIADNFQGSGCASLVMPLIIRAAQERGARSLVLMGGTQAGNAQAIRFYREFGFVQHGGYQTEVFNHDMRLLLAPAPLNGA